MDNVPIHTKNWQQEHETESFYALFFRYFSYWPWFIASIIICCMAMFLFIFYSTPIYKINSSVLIKVSDQSQYPVSSKESIGMQDIGLFSMTKNFDNEVEILQSKTLIHKVICDLNLYANITEERLWGYNMPLYKDSPIHIYMTPQEADKLESAIELHISYTANHRLYVKAEYRYMDKYNNMQEVEEEKVFDSLPAIYPTNVGTISFIQNDSVLRQATVNNIRLLATIQAPNKIVNEYKNQLTLKPTSKTTTIVQMKLENTIKERGVDFINALINTYNQYANDEKNEVAQKSAEFIEERLKIINQELSMTENQLVDFKQSSGLTNLSNDMKMTLEENSKYEQQRIANATQIRLVNYLKSYIENPTNSYEIIPINVGQEDENLNSIIERYNDLLVERKRLLRTSSESNPAVININTSIGAMYQNVKTAVNNVLKGLQIAQEDIDRQVRKLEYQIIKTPQNEKEFLTISRQQEIKASLYTMLLQKREENAITLASTAKNGRIIENAAPDKSPVFPRKLLFMVAALLIGLGIPVIFIYLRDFFKYKIEDSDEVKRFTNLSSICEIPYEKQAKGSYHVKVRKGQNGIIEEAFRGLRTQLQFLSRNKNQIILVTSSIPNEGKTFIASNLAISLSLLNKRVLIIGLDIRNPQLNKVFGLHSSKGITDYLGDPEQIHLIDLICPSENYENLDILVSGTIPPNPTELLSDSLFSETMNLLKKQYDYVIVDTAPISLVADTSIIALTADLGVFVCRMDFTPKEYLQNIHILRDQCNLSQLVCVVNGVDMNKRKHKYRYKYGKRYGYGVYQYGYGYGK